MDINKLDLAVVGGGAAGYFAALRAASLHPGKSIAIFDLGKRPLEKVRISGGGRCNVTNGCYDPAEFIRYYPRGSKELRGAFHKFQAKDTVEWFESRGVALKREADGRIFPCSDSSESIVDCLEVEREKLKICLASETRVSAAHRTEDGAFRLIVSERGQEHEQEIRAKCLVLATGSNRAGYEFVRTFGHQVTPLAPSLFTFKVSDRSLVELAGVSVENVSASLLIEDREVAKSSGPVLITHWGFSGPAVLRLSAWGARELSDSNYRGLVRVNWLGSAREDRVIEILNSTRTANSRKTVINTRAFSLPARLWEYLLSRAIPNIDGCIWSQFSRVNISKLANALTNSEFVIDGKGQFKDEFVTCGGVALNEIDFRTMASKLVQGLFIVGELLDVDGITGGFNFQNAWTTGWIAGSNLLL